MSKLGAENPPLMTVRVLYNGVEKPVRANAHETVNALLQQALNAFAIHENRHIMSLYTEDGAELVDSMKVADSGIQPGTLLLLRPSAVKGGVA
jgi:uncharacterized protein DUF2604